MLFFQAASSDEEVLPKITNGKAAKGKPTETNGENDSEDDEVSRILVPYIPQSALRQFILTVEELDCPNTTLVVMIVP